MSEKVFLIAGEKSGDVHAAELVDAMQELGDYNFFGLGGVDLAQRGEFADWVDQAAVIGLTEVVKKYGWFRKMFSDTIEQILLLSPRAVILVDYPGFNLRVAKALRKRGFKGEICYYISPQVWAWNKGRIPKMAKILDLMLCVFPFEKQLYEASGLRTEWVGHPLVEELEELKISEVRERRTIGLFPGSRIREIKALLPVMLQSSAQFLDSQAGWRIEVAVVSERVKPLVEMILRESPLADADQVTLRVGESHRLMQTASMGLIASGTATLEAAFYGLPYALVYKVSQFTYFMAKLLVKIDFIGIVNILAGKEIIREFIQADATSRTLSRELERLADATVRSELEQSLLKVVTQLGGGGAHHRAALAITELLDRKETM